MVSLDSMRADISIKPPDDGGSPVTERMIRDALAGKKISVGIDEALIRQLAAKPVYHVDMKIAEGVPPVHGENAVINPLVRTEKDIRPKEMEDGTVDYKDLGIVQTVRKDDVLCEKIPATQGEPGMNVYGAAISARPGKDIPLPAGKNTVPSADKLQLLAACDGHADIVNRKIQVLNTFTVSGNVSNSTGNINYLGNVVVDGSVLTGFAVQATGNITINGTVEGADIDAGGNIIIKEGVNGFSKGSVKAGGFIKTKYIQSGIVQAGGNIEAAFILHSKVQSGGNIFLLGARGTLVGGEVSAMKSINTMLAGGRNSYVYTQIEVGNDPAVLARSREIPKELDANKRDSATILRAIRLLSEHKKAGRLTPDKLESLQRAIDTYQRLTEHVAELEAEMEEISEVIASAGYGALNISGTVYPGVRVIIGPENMMVENKYDHCSFVRDDKGVQMVPLRQA
jgi:hypothetical protein